MTDRYHFRPAERQLSGALLRPVQNALAHHRPCYIWQAERFDLVVGVIAWQREPGSQSIATLAIHVDPTCRGQGVGRFLLSQALTVARDSGLHSLLVRVSHDNTAALALFNRFGFTPVLDSSKSEQGEAGIWLCKSIFANHGSMPQSRAA